MFRLTTSSYFDFPPSSRYNKNNLHLKGGVLEMNKLWFIPIFMFLFKLISNTYYFFRIKTLSHHYDEFLYKGNTRILKEASETIDLFKRAKVIDSKIPIVKKNGALVQTMSVSLFLNFPSQIRDLASATVKAFDFAEGFFLKNIRNCFNPVYWIDLIVFAPKHIFLYLGFDTNKVFIKILILFFNFIFWVISALIIPVFQEEIKIMIINLLKIFR